MWYVSKSVQNQPARDSQTLQKCDSSQKNVVHVFFMTFHCVLHPPPRQKKGSNFTSSEYVSVLIDLNDIRPTLDTLLHNCHRTRLTAGVVVDTSSELHRRICPVVQSAMIVFKYVWKTCERDPRVCTVKCLLLPACRGAVLTVKT